MAGIGDAGAAALGGALKANSTLATIILERNRIGDDGASALGAALRENVALTHLVLYMNEIGDKGASALAEGLEANSTLVELDLHNNRIGDAGTVALGEALRVNNALAALLIHTNNIGDAGATSLGEALRSNSGLKALGLQGNRIRGDGAAALSQALKTNDTLTQLSGVDWSSSSEPPAEVCSRGIDAIRQYWRDLEASAAVNWSLKAVLVGRGRAGKTSLLNTLRRGSPQLEQFDTRTIGIEMAPWRPFDEGGGVGELQAESGDPSKDLCLQFWDFAGQHEYYVTHHFFLTRGALYLLVFDVAAIQRTVNDFKFHIEFWIQSIMMHVPRAAFVVVAAHCDEVAAAEELEARVQFAQAELERVLQARRQTVEAALAAGVQAGDAALRAWAERQLAALPVQVGAIVPVSSRTLAGMSQLRRQLVAAARDRELFPHVGRAVPATYLRLQELVHGAAQECIGAGRMPLVPWAEFRQGIATRAGFAPGVEGDRWGALATHLAHDLGVLLRYDDEADAGGLANHVVLRPQWLTNVLKAVVRHDVFQPHRDPPLDLLAYRPEWVERPAAYGPADLERDKAAFFGGRAVLSRDLLVLLWRMQGGDLADLPSEAASLFIDMLQRMHLLFPMDSVIGTAAPGAVAADRCAFLVPARLAAEPADEFTRMWPVPDATGARLRAVEGVFEHHTPAGFFPRLLVALLRGMQPRLLWERGGLFAWAPSRSAASAAGAAAEYVEGSVAGGDALLLAELTDTLHGGEPRTTLRLSARHAAPSVGLAALHAALVATHALVAEWPGLSLPLFARSPADLDAGCVLARAERIPLRDAQNAPRGEWVAAAGVRIDLSEILPAPLAHAAAAAAAQPRRTGAGDKGPKAASRPDRGSRSPAAASGPSAGARGLVRERAQADEPGGGGGPLAPPLPPRLWAPGAPVDDAIAIVIGVDRYASDSLATLSCAAADAAWFEAVARGYGFRVVASLRDEHATKAAVEEAVDVARQLCPTYLPARLLAVFFAGHGLRVPKPDGVSYEGYLCLHDTRPERLTSTALSMTHLRALAEEIGAVQQLWVLDCCHAGEFLMGGSAGYVQAPAPAIGVGREDEHGAARAGAQGGSDLRDDLRQRAIYAFAATGGHQEAAELRADGHGLFTAALCSALERAHAAPHDADMAPEDAPHVRGSVDLSEVCSRVRKAVLKASPAEGDARQRPVFGRLVSGPGAVTWLVPAAATPMQGGGAGGSPVAAPSPVVGGVQRRGAGEQPIDGAAPARAVPPLSNPRARAVHALLHSGRADISVADVLQAAGLAQYTALFHDSGACELADLLDLDEALLLGMGVKPLHCRAFLTAREVLSESGLLNSEASSTMCAVT